MKVIFQNRLIISLSFSHQQQLKNQKLMSLKGMKQISRLNSSMMSRKHGERIILSRLKTFLKFMRKSTVIQRITYSTTIQILVQRKNIPINRIYVVVHESDLDENLLEA